jgi:hypothetical protein
MKLSKGPSLVSFIEGRTFVYIQEILLEQLEVFTLNSRVTQ